VIERHLIAMAVIIKRVLQLAHALFVQKVIGVLPILKQLVDQGKQMRLPVEVPVMFVKLAFIIVVLPKQNVTHAPPGNIKI